MRRILLGEMTAARLDEYRDVAKFENLCKSCPNYGTKWCCPPLSEALACHMWNERCSSVGLHHGAAAQSLWLGCSIEQSYKHSAAAHHADECGCEEDLPIVIIADVTRPYGDIRTERRLLEPLLLRYERAVGGFATAFTGMCDMCEQCTRPQGLPCRHPNVMRPSLEALGYDVTAIAKDLFGITLQWKGTDKPEYLTLIGAVFPYPILS